MDEKQFIDVANRSSVETEHEIVHYFPAMPSANILHS